MLIHELFINLQVDSYISHLLVEPGPVLEAVLANRQTEVNLSERGQKNVPPGWFSLKCKTRDAKLQKLSKLYTFVRINGNKLETVILVVRNLKTC